MHRSLPSTRLDDRSNVDVDQAEPTLLLRSIVHRETTSRDASILGISTPAWHRDARTVCLHFQHGKLGEGKSTACASSSRDIHKLVQRHGGKVVGSLPCSGHREQPGDRHGTMRVDRAGAGPARRLAVTPLRPVQWREFLTQDTGHDTCISNSSLRCAICCPSSFRSSREALTLGNISFCSSLTWCLTNSPITLTRASYISSPGSASFT
jgi:hypothetical protein